MEKSIDVIIVLLELFYFQGYILYSVNATYCGCKNLRPCYGVMLNDLLGPDEDACIENVAMGASTITIFLQALSQFCGEVIKVHNDSSTYENRLLYEVVLNTSNEDTGKAKPVILLEAGQQAGSDSVMLALFIIEQLVACEEYDDMLEKVNWVILPCTNPDGQEYVRCNREPWYKNMVPVEDSLSFGVDISRNFDDSWNTCAASENIFSQEYPGPSAASENETQFISNIIEKYKKDLKAYVSIRRDGHSILYPFASKSITTAAMEKAQHVAGEMAAIINQRYGNIQWFQNTSIHDMNGETRCGHSVDYAYNKHGIPYTYEMRVFPESNDRIMTMFQTFPKGYEASLRHAYFSGIRTLFNIVANEKTRRTFY